MFNFNNRLTFQIFQTYPQIYVKSFDIKCF